VLLEHTFSCFNKSNSTYKIYMYKKLIANLPFNPSLIGQVSFYARRVHQEERIRRIGVFFVILSLFVQIFAVIAQPEPSLARSNNDIVPGGFSTQAEALEHCRQNNYDFGSTLAYFGVSCGDLQDASRESVRSTNYDKKLLSLGRLPYGKEGERSVRIDGKTYYQRYLWSWDSWAYSTYDVLAGERSDGTPFMVLYNCGNITVVESEPEEQSYAAYSTLIQGGSSGGGGSVFPGGGTFNAAHSIESNRPTVSSMSDVAISRDEIVGIARVRAPDTISHNGRVWERQGSSHCYNTSDCRNDGVVHTLSVRSYNMQQPEYVQTYWFYEPVENTQPEPEPEPERTPEPQADPEPQPRQEPEPEPIDACPEIPGVQNGETECNPCEEAKDRNDTTACLVLSKTAENKTQSITSADGTVAQPGDEITYTLATQNTGQVAIDDFQVEESISDVLEYALVRDFHGGDLNDNATVRWPAKSIEPGETLTQQLTIQIKDTLPQTPVAESNPGSYDLLMTNVYGDTVEIELPASLPKTTEQVVQTLPNTGPGDSLFISVIVTVLVGYFFARTKLYRKELDIIRHEAVAGGGYV